METAIQKSEMQIASDRILEIAEEANCFFIGFMVKVNIDGNKMEKKSSVTINLVCDNSAFEREDGVLKIKDVISLKEQISSLEAIKVLTENMQEETEDFIRAALQIII